MQSWFSPHLADTTGDLATNAICQAKNEAGTLAYISEFWNTDYNIGVLNADKAADASFSGTSVVSGTEA